jgi:lipopolysaccharide transport system ATP-binding protein
MDHVAIRAQGLSKRYSLGGPANTHSYRTLRQALVDLAAAPARRLRRLRGETAEAIWALKDVSFEVPAGEAVGIVGRNGAGKSTLLKILCRITHPTSGRAEIRGRAGSLLEVGTGFHPELSGRENVYLNGAILGMRRREIDRRFDEIVAFAELERFIDTPVRHYSTGMYMRLAFAVAAHLDPEILLVDEVLAVGDASFQRRCLGRMREVAQGGRTVLFVSHNMVAVKTLCQRALLIADGRVAMDGPASAVVDRYLSDLARTGVEALFVDPEKAPGNEKARLVAVRVLQDGRALGEAVPIDSPVTIEVEYRTLVEGARLNVSLALYTQDDVYVLSSPSISDPHWFGRPHPVGRFRSRCVLPGSLLNESRYAATVFLVEDLTRAIAVADRVVSFETLDRGTSRGGYFGYWGGIVRPQLPWVTEHLE